MTYVCDKSSIVAAMALRLAVVLFCLGGVDAHARTLGNIPYQVALQTANTASQSKVCVIGTSQRMTTVPAYYLTGNSQKQGVWTLTNSKSVATGLELRVDINSIVSQPNAAYPPFVNAGNIRFFLVSGSTSCSSIQYTFTNWYTGQTADVNYPYPLGLLEISTYPSGANRVMTIDTSNVDSFELPLLAEVSKAGTPAGSFGNPITPAVLNLKTMITGPAGNGTGSPFLTWLQQQPDYQSGPNLFAALLRSSAAWNSANPSSSGAGSYPFAMLDSPTGFFSYKCLQNGTEEIPAQQCPLANAYIHRNNLLIAYYHSELTTFFKDAVGLVVMGDAQAGFAQQPWLVTSNTADCPIFRTRDGHSLQFNSKAGSVIVCNPLEQIVPMGGPAPIYSQAPAKYGQPTKATVQITELQYNAFRGKLNWNFGQPDSGWIGNITGFQVINGQYFIHLAVLGTPTSPSSQTICIPRQHPMITCPTANPSFTSWSFTNVKYTTSTNPFEEPSEMVFGNDGAFSSWLYYANADKMTVTQSIERNIVAALSRGIARCNNLTMNGFESMPLHCASVKALPVQACPKKGPCVCPDGAPTCVTANAVLYEPKTAKDPPAYVTASDAYWSNESNWYPASGPQNYYAQFLHTARLNQSGLLVAPGTTCTAQTCFNVFDLPNGMIPGPASSNQGVPMGMVYGFSLDENPDYLAGVVAQVPSKLDPIPVSWGTGLDVTVTIGGSQ